MSRLISTFSRFVTTSALLVGLAGLGIGGLLGVDLALHFLDARKAATAQPELGVYGYQQGQQHQWQQSCAHGTALQRAQRRL